MVNVAFTRRATPLPLSHALARATVMCTYRYMYIAEAFSANIRHDRNSKTTNLRETGISPWHIFSQRKYAITSLIGVESIIIYYILYACATDVPKGTLSNIVTKRKKERVDTGLPSLPIRKQTDSDRPKNSTVLPGSSDTPTIHTSWKCKGKRITHRQGSS